MYNGSVNWIANFIWSMADVVTGKLDVREAALGLPDEAHESEPVDEIEADDGTEGADAEEVDA